MGKSTVIFPPSDVEENRMDDSSLSMWMRALIGYVRSGEPDLTNRQMALLMLVYLTPGPHTVRGLAKVLGVSKPVVTRALNTLGGLGYLRRERDQDDRRNIFVVRTSEGADFLEGFKRNLRAGEEGVGSQRPFIGQREPERRQPAFANR
jgi:DNA-binding MarR family transcriptional regulator